MSTLRVRLRGKMIYELPLSEAQTYVAGRKEDCDIVLQPEKGISREHFKLSFQEDVWTVEVISRYGEVLVGGEQVQHFSLENGSQFSVPPYEFEYSQTVQESQASSGEDSHLPAISNSEGMHEFGGNEEKTVIGAAPMSAYIKMVDSQNEATELLRLEAGDSWLAGRDATCHIQIRDQRVSRRQFEIRRFGSQYMIIDLGSVNGTLVNGNPISSTDATPLKSGDAISVLSNYLYFELHDSSFQSRLEMVAVAPINPMIASQSDAMPMSYQGPDLPEVASAPYPQQPIPLPPPASISGKFDFQKNRPKIIGAAVVLLAVAYLFSGNENKGPAAPTPGIATPGSSQEAFGKLQPEQQALVRQRYKDAKNLYMQGKYQLAQDEIVKIQELVPDYEDIREIERLSKEAIFIQEQQRRQEQIEKAKIETEEKIQKQTALCQKKINPRITDAELEECLAPVLQFNPEHPRILELKTQVEMITAQKEARAAERMVYQSQVAKLRGLYTQAQQVHRRGKPLEAIAAYERVLDAKLPDPSGFKGQSKRSIASLKAAMNSRTAKLQADAERQYQSQNLKAAILSLRKARAIDPMNLELSDKIERYVIELRKQMLALYQEGILEESFGNVEGGESKAGAKDKWKKILELDVPDGEYYKKAYIKLKKYGAL